MKTHAVGPSFPLLIAGRWLYHRRVRATPLLILLLAPLASGCSALHREEYSLVFRKPAHLYRKPTPVETDLLRTASDPAPPSDDESDSVPEGAGEPAGLDLRYALTRDPFRPFAYCYLHESSHVPESVVAALAAPVEYPVCFTGSVAGATVRGTAAQFAALWAWLFPSEPEAPPPDEPTDPARRQ